MCGTESTNTSRAKPFLLFVGKERNNMAAPEDGTLRETDRQTDRRTERPGKKKEKELSYFV